jgi:hypothetical protein
MEHHLASKYIVAQAILSPSDAPLSFTWLQSCQFLDWMQSRAAGCRILVVFKGAGFTFTSIGQ